MTEQSCLLLCDFNPANFAALLARDPSPPRLRVTTAAYGEAQQALLRADAPCWRDRPDAAVVWTMPASVAEAYRRIEGGEEVSAADLQREVDAHCAAIASAAGRAGVLLVPTWVSDDTGGAYSLARMRPGVGPAHALLRMNLRLAESLEGVRGVHVLDGQRWVSRAGADAFSEKLWYLAKVPFTTEVFRAAAADVKAALRAVRGDVRKLIVLDLDDTLWGGIVGDVGWENLVLGGHNPAGEAFADFQRALKAMAARGVLLAIASKNEEGVAMEAIRRHPEMVLRESDFAARRIGWGDKAQSIADLAAELNLGLQSVVFIDDSPAERERVRSALPEVLVPEWPADKSQYRRALCALDCFNAAVISDEDRRRTSLYHAESRRAELRRGAASYDEWLRGLGVTVTVRPLDAASLPRACELLNKTNQMNLSTRRLTEEELWRWASGGSRRFLTLRVSDRFGDYGLTGLLSVEEDGKDARLVDFVLSCRVIGRRVEECMLHLAVEQARRRGLARVRARYLATAKNKPCRAFLDGSGLAAGDEPDEFVWPADRPYPLPDGIRLLADGDAT